MKKKFSNCFEEVNKAFIKLDSDYDGFITIEDILKYFGNETDLNYNDLKKLMKDKDSKKEGKISYNDFSKWLGNTIHSTQGCYFRMNSYKNPEYELNLQKNIKSFLDSDKNEAARLLMVDNVEKKIIEKMKI